ncbi:MAG: PadR family transcriptional regulator [Blautia sp.]|nr:PadR family transcriptional regulator [Blautia sp.]
MESERDGGKLKPKYEQQMKKGVLEMLVLRLLSEKEKYGYQLICELRDQSDDMFLLKEGTLYPILYRMEDDGLVASRWSEPKGREVSRKYYGITAEGRDTLEQLRTLWGRFSEKVDSIMKGV